MNSEDDFAEIEAQFRWRYERIHERTTRCYNQCDERDPCKNFCHFLIASDIDERGYPPAVGIDCSVFVASCGGDDIDNSSIVAYCAHCTAAQRAWRRDKELREETERQAHREDAARTAAVAERRNRAKREFWINQLELDFEQQYALRFCELGFVARVTPRTNDGGLDIILEKGGKRGAAQCKACISPIGVKQLREFYGALHAEQMSFGFFISRSGFTPRARFLFAKMPLLTGWTIDDLLSHAPKLSR
jgi:hypothetical protein